MTRKSWRDVVLLALMVAAMLVLAACDSDSVALGQSSGQQSDDQQSADTGEQAADTGEQAPAASDQEPDVIVPASTSIRYTDPPGDVHTCDSDELDLESGELDLAEWYFTYNSDEDTIKIGFEYYEEPGETDFVAAAFALGPRETIPLVHKVGDVYLPGRIQFQYWVMGGDSHTGVSIYRDSEYSLIDHEPYLRAIGRFAEMTVPREVLEQVDLDASWLPFVGSTNMLGPCDTWILMETDAEWHDVLRDMGF